MLYGMIGVLGVKIWVQNKVNFSNPVNLTTAAVALIIGIADYTWTIGDLKFTGIALGLGRGPGDLPRHEGHREGPRHGGRTGNRAAGPSAGGKAALNAASETRPEEALIRRCVAAPDVRAPVNRQ